MSYAALSELVFSALGDILQVKKWRILRATCLREIVFQIRKNFYGDFSDVATGLWGGMFEPYAMLRVVSAFQIGQNLHRRW